MDAGTLFVMIVGVVGLVAVVVLRTRGARTTMGARANLMSRQHGPNAVLDDDVREQALLLIDRGEKIAAIKLLHEQADLGLREARDMVAHLEHTTTFVRDEDDAPPARPAHDEHAERHPRSGWDERPAERAGWDERPAERSGWDERPAAPARPDWDDAPSRPAHSGWDERPAAGGWDSSPSPSSWDNSSSGSDSGWDSGSSSSSDSGSSSSSDY